MLYEYLSALISKIKAWCKRGRNELKRESVAGAGRGEEELDIEAGRGREGEVVEHGQVVSKFSQCFPKVITKWP